MDIALSPHVDLCLAFPNGNGLACITEISEPTWIRRSCSYIGYCLKSVAKRATVFVGEAALCPGVPHPEVYKALLKQYHYRLTQSGVSLQSTAVGVQLEADNIHWSSSSQTAVADLVGHMVDTAKDTRQLQHTASPHLWHWRFDKLWLKHFPCCTKCNKLSSDQHLGSKIHEQSANGTQMSFDFPDRERLATEGIEFCVEVDGQVCMDTRDTLPAYHWARQRPTKRPDHWYATSVSVQQHNAEPLSPNTSISKKCTISIGFDDGSTESHIPCQFRGNGQARDGFGVDDAMDEDKVYRRPALAFKCQIMNDKEDRNMNEWLAYINTPKLHPFITKVYGHFYQDIAQTKVSFLLVAKVSFTFAEMTLKIHTVKPTALKCLLVLKCCQRVMQTFMDAARSGLHCHDWHTGNIGFMDDLALHMVLIDFEGNREASPAESYTNRINNALLCFLRYLPGPHTYSQGQDFARYFADQSPEVQNNINHWKSIMTMMAETYLKWWKIGQARPCRTNYHH